MAMRLLLVDDERPVLQLLSALLKASGAEVLSVGDSHEAARHLEDVAFDAAVFNVHMSTPGSLDLTRLARGSSLNRKTPVVVFSGFDDDETTRRALEAGATCISGKPITREKIRRVLKILEAPIFLDRRSQVRLPFRAVVKCNWGRWKGKQIIAESLNLGEGGMLLESSGRMRVGQELNLEFRLPCERKPLCTRAKIDRLEPPNRIGVEFLETSPCVRDAIQNFVIRRLQT
jgi:CheY-like chemotaxis protein